MFWKLISLSSLSRAMSLFNFLEVIVDAFPSFLQPWLLSMISTVHELLCCTCFDHHSRRVVSNISRGRIPRNSYNDAMLTLTGLLLDLKKIILYSVKLVISTHNPRFTSIGQDSTNTGFVNIAWSTTSDVTVLQCGQQLSKLPTSCSRSSNCF